MFVLTLPCCSRGPSKVLAVYKKKKKEAPSTDKENDVVGWFLFEALIELGTSHFLG